MTKERYCIGCGDKIKASNGFVLARDFIDFLEKTYGIKLMTKSSFLEKNGNSKLPHQ